MVTYGRIEQSSTDAEENPGIDSQGHPKAQGNEHERTCITRGTNNVLLGCMTVKCYLCSSKGKHQEHRSAYELGDCRDKVVARLKTMSF